MEANYLVDYKRLFDGSRPTAIDDCSSAVAKLPKEFTSNDVFGAHGCCDCWIALNALDHLVTLGELQELTDRDTTWGQNRRYRKLEA